MTAKVLGESNKVFFSTYQKTQSFNCSLQTARLTNVCVGLVMGATAKTACATRIVEVPFMTNYVAVEAGEELLVEKPEERVAIAQSKKQQQMNTWKVIEKKNGAPHIEKQKEGNKKKEQNAIQRRCEWWRMCSCEWSAVAASVARPAVAVSQAVLWGWSPYD